MSILANGPNGGFSGKAGSVVGYYLYGKWVIRGLPKLSPKNKIGSPMQKLYRSRFSKMQTFQRPLLGFIRVGFNLEARLRGNSAINSANSWNMQHGFLENGDIDYSAIKVSSGNLPGAVNAQVAAGEDGLVFTWADNSEDDRSNRKDVSRHSDQVMLLAYDMKDRFVCQVLSGARRSECKAILKVSDQPGSEWHTWIAFISDDRESIATSVYTGMVV